METENNFIAKTKCFLPLVFVLLSTFESFSQEFIKDTIVFTEIYVDMGSPFLTYKENNGDSKSDLLFKGGDVIISGWVIFNYNGGILIEFNAEAANEIIGKKVERIYVLEDNGYFTAPMVHSLTLIDAESFGQINSSDSIFVDPENRNYGWVNLSSQSFGVYSDPENYNLSHQFFGYEFPSIESKKLIVYSCLTSDVEGNPHNCLLGAYYSTDMSDLEFNGEILFISEENDFVKMKFIKDSGEEIIFYFLKEWIKFSN